MDGHAALQGLPHPDDLMESCDDNPPSILQMDAKPSLPNWGLPTECDPPPSCAYQPPANASSALFDQHMKPIEDNFEYLNVHSDLFGIASKALATTILPRSWDKWTWGMRGEGQFVLPYMAIAPTKVIRDMNFMEKNNFSLVVILRDKRMAQFTRTATDVACDDKLPRVDVLKAAAEQHCQFSRVEYQEKRNDKSANWNPKIWNTGNGLREIISFLVNHRISAEEERLKNCDAEDEKEATDKFLIACDTGNDWSPVVVAAYIMAVFGMSIEEAHKFIFNYRFSCADFAANRRLEGWEQLLTAAADVTASGASIKDQNRQHLKRAPDSDLDHDRGRESSSPFS